MIVLKRWTYNPSLKLWPLQCSDSHMIKIQAFVSQPTVMTTGLQLPHLFNSPWSMSFWLSCIVAFISIGTRLTTTARSDRIAVIKWCSNVTFRLMTSLFRDQNSGSTCSHRLSTICRGIGQLKWKRKWYECGILHRKGMKKKLNKKVEQSLLYNK